VTGDAQYAAAVGFAIGRRRDVWFPTPGICPECGQRAVTMTEDEQARHVIIRSNVVIGCEGFWCADPASVGLPRGQWAPPVEAGA
jgi:hypothetical protein